MKNTYFPHLVGGDINKLGTLNIGYNLSPAGPIAIDPRYIINSFDDETLSWLTYTEVYVGLQIYCLSNRTLYICRWIPEKTPFSGNECLWDILHTDDADDDEWVDITTMNIETISDKIAKKVNEQYKLIINNKNGYWGFYNFSNDTTVKEQLSNEDTKNEVMFKLINYVKDNNYMSGTYNSIKMSNKTQTLNMLEFNLDGCKEHDLDGNLIVVVPTLYNTVDKINYISSEKTPDPIVKTLQYRVAKDDGTNTQYIMEDCDYNMYIVEDKLDEYTILNLIKGTLTISISFKKL